MDPTSLAKNRLQPAVQHRLFSDHPTRPTTDPEPFKLQFLKWIGSKQRVAHKIISFFPDHFGRYIEPFLGSAAVLGTLAPRSALASDVLNPLIELWNTLKTDPALILEWYRSRWERYQDHRTTAYEEIKTTYNREPNAPDLLFLSRSCYGGVIRFRLDGYISTPVGIHNPITPAAMSKRITEWHRRIQGTTFVCSDFETSIAQAGAGDIVYCDPPYSHTQQILYGAQRFSLERLLDAIARAKGRGAFVALSIDGKKKSGAKICHVPVPEGLFEHTAYLGGAASMLRRFQMEGETLEQERVVDRLLLTW